MRSKASYAILLGAVLASASLTLLITTARATYPMPSMTPPPPPTPGPPPTEVPRTRRGDPVADRAEAIERALAIDAECTMRERPLTVQMIEAKPDMVVVRSYGTWKEIGGGGVLDPDVISQAIWVVTFKGRASLRVLGGGRGMVKVDGVTYTFSQRDGSLLAIYGGSQE